MRCRIVDETLGGVGMIQKMRNLVTINVRGVNLYEVTDIEVCLEQNTTELIYSGENVEIGNETQLLVNVPKSVAMNLDFKKPMRGQVMFTKNGVPCATNPFTFPVLELLKGDGYGD